VKEVAQENGNDNGIVKEVAQENGNDNGVVKETAQENGEENGDDNDETEDWGGTGNIAWETLEVARAICDKQEPTTEWLEKKANVLVALGECMVVGENFEKALEEFNNALELQMKIFEPHNRRIAETYYHIGITHKNKDDFEKAAEGFKKAGEVLRKTMEHIGSSGDPSSAEELSNLKKIIDDVDEQVQDALDSAEARKKQLEERTAFLKNLLTGVLAPADANDDTVVNDISNLVRRGVKRPATSSDATMTTSTTTEATAGEGSSIEAIVGECLSTTVEPKADEVEPSDKKAKLDE